MNEDKRESQSKQHEQKEHKMKKHQRKKSAKRIAEEQRCHDLMREAVDEHGLSIDEINESAELEYSYPLRSLELAYYQPYLLQPPLRRRKLRVYMEQLRQQQDQNSLHAGSSEGRKEVPPAPEEQTFNAVALEVIAELVTARAAHVGSDEIDDVSVNEVLAEIAKRFDVDPAVFDANTWHTRFSWLLQNMYHYGLQQTASIKTIDVTLRLLRLPRKIASGKSTYKEEARRCRDAGDAAREEKKRRNVRIR